MKIIREILRKIVKKSTGKLVTKLVFIFSFIIVLTVASLTLISYNIIQRESIKNMIASNSNNLELVNKNFEDYLQDINQFAFPQFNYERVMNAIIYEGDDYTSKLYLEDYVRTLYYSRKDIEGVYLYLLEQKKYYYIVRQVNDTKVRENFDGQVPRQHWFQSVLENKNNIYIQSLLLSNKTGYSVNKDKSVLAYHRGLINIRDRKCKAIISLFLNAGSRDKVFSGIPVIQNEHILFLDSENTPFYLDDKQYYMGLLKSGFINALSTKKGSGVFDWNSGADKCLAVLNITETDHWKLIKLIPYNAIYRAAQTNRNVSFAVGGIFLMISVLIVIFTLGAITKPLKELSGKMSKFSEGNFDVEAIVKGHDEVAQLSSQFNLMVEKINDLINEEYKMKLVEKSAILKALEAEINPHFLYNALQAVSTKALKSSQTEISNMVDALASTFRYCISGLDIVKTHEEIKHIENYLVIQKARFGDRLNVLYELDQNALEYNIPILSIQTLIENSIKHAVETISKPITIIIRVIMSGQGIIISVSDNGPGISPEKMEALLDLLQSQWDSGNRSSIGLRNLNTRLKLLYGEASSVRIKTDENGTQISFAILREG